MISNYKTIFTGGVGELIEKKSRFIATVIPVTAEEDALAFIEQTKKKYWDANHNCSAFVIGANNELLRCSDDGEPSGTAGKPMLDVLLNEGIHNCAVVVTRYFGGTLLGTGGLVRAYIGATKEGLANSVIIEKNYGKKLLITTDYPGFGKLQYQAATEELIILDTEYSDIVKVTLLMPPEKEDGFVTKLLESTNGTATIDFLEEVYYAKNKKETLLFPILNTLETK